MTEADIIHESASGDFWVYRSKKQNAYLVMRTGLMHSVSMQGYALTDDGKSLAIADCEYREKHAIVRFPRC